MIPLYSITTCHQQVRKYIQTPNDSNQKGKILSLLSPRVQCSLITYDKNGTTPPTPGQSTNQKKTYRQQDQDQKSNKTIPPDEK